MVLLPPVQAESGGETGQVCATLFLPKRRRAFIGAQSEEITGLLRAWSSGDQAALARLAEQVYPELRLMARRYMKNERQANTLQTTALVHEV